jgi:DNA-directed primase/polymerase protein
MPNDIVYDPRIEIKPRRNKEEEEKNELFAAALKNVRALGSSDFYGDEASADARVDPKPIKKVKITKGFDDESEWVVESRQQDMFERVEALKLANPDYTWRYFCREHHASGKRQYLATTHDKLWSKYEQLGAHERHYYELIVENTPCYLYFDLEFSILANPLVHGETLTDYLIALVCEEFALTDEIDASDFKPEEHIIELDSTSATKFSRHLIFRLPGRRVFANNAHCAHFVRKLWARVAATRDTDPRCAALFVRKNINDEEAHESFVDLGVYTRNRVFRLYLSSKRDKDGGQKPILKPTSRFWKNTKRAVGKDEDVPDRLTFLKSCATHVGPNPKLIQFPGVTHSSVLVGKQFQGYRNGTVASRNRAEFGGNSIGPCPRTAAFVCHDFDRWSAHHGASVRSWTAFPEYGVLVLNLFGNRYCENIERAHKSNNVMFVVDFRENAYYQRCHDPECRGTRGPWRELSKEVLVESYNLAKMLPDAPSFEELDDEALAESVVKKPRSPSFEELDDDDLTAL